MRTALLLLIAASPFGSGCAAYVAGSGNDLSKLATRDEVYEQFGRPDEAMTYEGQEYWEYRTRRKIANKMLAHSWKLAAGMSCGAADLILLPIELVAVAEQTIRGQTLRFCYDSEGRVHAVQLNGADVRGMYFPTSATSESSKGQQQAIQNPP